MLKFGEGFLIDTSKSNFSTTALNSFSLQRQHSSRLNKNFTSCLQRALRNFSLTEMMHFLKLNAL